MDVLLIEILNPYYTGLDVDSHELNENYTLPVGFTFNGERINTGDIDVAIVTANIVSLDRGIIIENVASNPYSGPGGPAVLFNIGKNILFELPPGKNLIEFKIELVQENKVVCPIRPTIIRVTPSILDDAPVTPESLGSYSEVVQEIAEARGAYSTLDNRLNSITSTYSVGFNSNNVSIKYTSATQIGAGAFSSDTKYIYVSKSVTAITAGLLSTAPNITDIYVDNKSSNITVASAITSAGVNVHYAGSFNLTDAMIVALCKIKEETDGKLDDTDGEISTRHLADGAVTGAKIAPNAVTTGKINDGAVEEAKLAPSSVTSAKIKNGEIGIGKLDTSLQTFLGTVDDLLTEYNSTDFITFSDLGTIQNTTPLNSALNNKIIYNFIVSAGAAQTFGVDSGTAAQMVFIGDYQVVTFATYAKKVYRLIESYAPTFSAGAWTVIDVDGRLDTLESTVGTVNAVLQAIVDGGAANE